MFTFLLLSYSLVSAGTIGCPGGFLAIRGCKRHQGGGGLEKHDLHDIREKVSKLIFPFKTAPLCMVTHFSLSVPPPSCSGVDPTTVAVLMEDGGALMGLAIAGREGGNIWNPPCIPASLVWPFLVVPSRAGFLRPTDCDISLA